MSVRDVHSPQMSLYIPPFVDHLPNALSFVHKQALSAGFNEKNVWMIELAVEEALVNCIRHGQLSDSGILLVCEKTDPAGLKVSLKDRGIPYCFPKTHSRYSERDSSEHPPIGGCGIALIKKCMDDTTYDRIENENILTMIKYVGSPYTI